jgi:hypothetical protein
MTVRRRCRAIGHRSPDRTSAGLFGHDAQQVVLRQEDATVSPTLAGLCGMSERDNVEDGQKAYFTKPELGFTHARLRLTRSNAAS